MPDSPVRFTDPPPSRRKATGPVLEAVPVDLAHQGDAVSSLSPDDEALDDLFPEKASHDGDSPVATDGSVLLIHILEDGFTAHGQVWYRGQEIEYTVGEQVYEDTKDRRGNTWLNWDDATQMRNWGKVNFRRGPWPGGLYEDPRAAAAELARLRKPKALAGVAPRLTGR